MNKTLVHSLRIVELKAFKQGPHKRGASVTRLIVLRFLYTSISRYANDSNLGALSPIGHTAAPQTRMLSSGSSC